MKIKTPKHVNDCTLEQLGQWSKLSEEVRGVSGFENLDFKIRVVSIFTGERYDKLRSISVRDINSIYNGIMKMLSSFEPTPPNSKIKVKDKTYVFEKDFTKISAGQVLDIKLIEDIYLDAAKLMAILHVEEGMTYSQEDRREVVLNPTSKRTKVFEESFPGEQYLNVMDFFLKFYFELKEASDLREITKARIQMEKTQMNLKKEVKKIKANGRNGIFGLKIFKRSRTPLRERRTK